MPLVAAGRRRGGLIELGSTVEKPPAGTPSAPGPSAGGGSGRRRRRTLVLAGGVLVVIAVGVALAISDPFASGKASSKVIDNGTSTSLATVTQGPLSQQVNSSGTLGYLAQADGSPYSIVNQASGAFTELPSAGDVVRCGHVLYRVANNPVVLLCGGTPAYRSLSEGDEGPDVRELNANLVRLGYATSSELDLSSDYFSSETAYALERLQGKLGEEKSGSLDLGQAVFLPGPLRITNTTSTLGTMAGPGMPVMQASSIARQVEVDLDASEQSSVKVGQKALITLPDNKTTPGTVTRIGTVASSSSSGSAAGASASGSSTTTIPVYVTLAHPTEAGGLDEAPVQVQITTAGVKNGLIVPSNALLALSGGRYAVETVDADRVHHLVPVTLGLFDDAEGLVQVMSPTLSAGQRIVVPSV